ncbi:MULTISPECIES: hypothetical protein [Enterobacteriaceae]|uniref:Uncharacterized protein n=1 Tax=Myoviridae sp. ctfOA1 TaxID=2825148 RepID=A0A8S5P4J8_9CAUD|nr:MULTISPECIES: hypothetical protein [Enterobacteriaceae]MDX5581235.1 hypothetical protein [Escherichia coli]MDY8050929.1 hypothetical protein [Escherichia coli]DAE01581.1 MAG TPA: hypothetical protein [Myoviridae sp. ctfOA1]
MILTSASIIPAPAGSRKALPLLPFSDNDNPKRRARGRGTLPP